jgi:hypothetical protein
MQMTIDNLLKTKFQSPGQTSESSRKRYHNIQWAINLPREGLTYKRKVKQALIHTTEHQEKLYIQYPGKESARADNKNRPYDFFPMIDTPNGYIDDYASFWEIWRLLFEQLEPRKIELKDEIRMLAVLFYRMAFMVDHNFIEYPQISTREISYNNDGQVIVNQELLNDFPGVYEYQPPTEIIKYLSDRIVYGKISFEAFIHYNNLLAWNEDCKYYHRAILKAKPWAGSVGRINTLLTHVSILGLLLGELQNIDIFYKFATGAGVAPVTNEEIQRISGGLITKSHNKFLL